MKTIELLTLKETDLGCLVIDTVIPAYVYSMVGENTSGSGKW